MTREDAIKNLNTKIMSGTGSGYVNDRGQVIAVNDVGYVSLPDGRGYAIAVLVRDYGGPQSDADSVIAAISAEVYDYVSQQVR